MNKEELKEYHRPPDGAKISRRLNPATVIQQISNIILQYPELAEDEILRGDMIEGETEADDLLTRLVRMIEDARALSEGTEQRLKDLQARRDRFNRRIEAYRALILKIMQAADLRKRELPEATISVRAAGQKVIITDESVLPDTVCKFIRKPDLVKIKEILQAAKTDGLIGAMLGNGGETLTIRVK